MKKIIDFLEGEFNKYDLFYFRQDDDDQNLIYVIWKDTRKKFATLYLDMIVRCIDEIELREVEMKKAEVQALNLLNAKQVVSNNHILRKEGEV